MRHYSHSCPRSLSCYDLVGLHEQFHAVRTDDPHFLGAPDDGTALGTYPPPGAALCLGRLRGSGLTAAGSLAACSGACHIRPCQTLTHLDVLPALEDDEVQQLFGRARDGPAILFVVVDGQPVCLCLLLKAPVVVDPVVAGVLDASHNGWSGMLYDRSGTVNYSAHYDVDIVDRVGGGDSFTGAIIYSLITGKSDKSAIEFAVAASCLKQSIEGDYNRITVNDVENLVNNGGNGRVER